MRDMGEVYPLEWGEADLCGQVQQGPGARIPGKGCLMDRAYLVPSCFWQRTTGCGYGQS